MFAARQGSADSIDGSIGTTPTSRGLGASRFRSKRLPAALVGGEVNGCTRFYAS